MNSLTLLFVVIAIASAAAGNGRYYDVVKDGPALFAKFEKEFSRQYKNAEDRQVRYQIFMDNLKVINHLNSESSGAFYGIGPFTDMSDEEFDRLYRGRHKLRNHRRVSNVHIF